MAENNNTSNISVVISVISSIVTIGLTVLNSYNTAEINRLEVQLKNRETTIDESKERIERYKWVSTLFPSLEEDNIKKKNFTISLIRLALDSSEARQLFSSLEVSGDKTLQSVGQAGINAIRNEPILALVSNMNSNIPNTRKSAVEKLIREYGSSPEAIEYTIQLYSPEKISSLSPSGLINGLSYLKRTDPQVWKPRQIEVANQTVRRILETNKGPQTQFVGKELLNFLKEVKSSNM